MMTLTRQSDGNFCHRKSLKTLNLLVSDVSSHCILSFHNCRRSFHITEVNRTFSSFNIQEWLRFLDFFFIWTVFKDFIEFVTVLLLCYV